MYPNGAHPNFTIISTTLVPTERSQYIQNLNNLSKSAVQQSCPCIEQIISHTIEFLELQQVSASSAASSTNTEIPCPRIAGATFTADGRLIYFRNFSFQNGKQVLPHTYDGLLKFVEQPVSLDESRELPNARVPHSISSYYYTDDIRELSIRRNTVANTDGPLHETRKNLAPNVIISDVSNLIIIDKELASSYKITGETVQEVCQHNAEAAAALNHSDLCKTWQLLGSIGSVELYSNPSTNSNQKPNRIPVRRYASVSSGRSAQNPRAIQQQPAWVSHPFAKQLTESLFSHYQKVKDVQTLAIMACVLSLPPNPLNFFVCSTYRFVFLYSYHLIDSKAQ